MCSGVADENKQNHFFQHAAGGMLFSRVKQSKLSIVVKSVSSNVIVVVVVRIGVCKNKLVRFALLYRERAWFRRDGISPENLHGIFVRVAGVGREAISRALQRICVLVVIANA